MNPSLRHHILLSTSMLVALTGYGRRAYAACANVGGSQFECSGDETTTQAVSANNAQVTAQENFSVDTIASGGNALVISGAGAISYTDTEESPLTADHTALFIQSTGDIGGGNAGSVTVDTNGTLSGLAYGIRAYNNGTGELNITARGDVTGTNEIGILATSSGSALNLTTGPGSTVTGAEFGIQALNFASGVLTIKANGDVTGTVGDAINAQNFGGTDVNVITGVGTTVTGDNSGVYVRNYGTGALNVEVFGDVIGQTFEGIDVVNRSGGTTLSVFTSADSTVTGDDEGIFARNQGSGVLTIEVNGDVTGTTSDAIRASQEGAAAAAVEITIGADATVTSQGIQLHNFAVDASGGPTDLTVAGTLNGGAGGAVQFDQFVARADRLELHTTAAVNGLVLAGTGTDTLAFAGTGAGAFDLDDIDTGGNTQQYRGFEVFNVDNGVWNFSGITTAAFEVNGGTMTGTGTFGDVTLNDGGTIAPGDPGIPGTLTVANFTSNGGALLIESVLGDDDSPTDLLVITGNSVMNPDGTTQVFVTNLGGTGAPTFNGIKIVDVEGAESTGLFELNGDFEVSGADAVIGGAFAYSLFQNGVEDPLDGDWYLRSIGFAPTTAAYEAMPGVLLGLMELPTLQQRVGDRIYGLAGGGGADLPTVEEQAVEAQGYSGARNLWTRIEGAHSHVEGDSTTDASYDATRWLVQLGLDGQFVDNGSGVVVGGINLQYAHADADISSASGDGDVSADSFGVGATLTWYGDSGIYVDGQAAVAYQLSDVSSDIVGDLVDDNDGWGYALSIEAGRKVGLGGNWGITPQAQLSYSSIDFDDFTDPFGADIALDSGDSLVGRLGVSLDYDAIGNGSRGHLYTIANLTYEFLDGTSVDVSGTAFEFDPEAFGGELGIGGTYEWAGGRYAIHGEALGQTDFGDGYGFKGTAGVEARF